jgi:hypothetical protein
VSTATLERTTPTPTAPATPERIRWAIALGIAVLLVVVAHFWGRWLQARGHDLFVNLPPLVGHLDPRVAWQAVFAPVVGLAAIAFGPRLAVRLSWRRLLVAATLGAVAWAVALALTEGVEGILRSPSSPRDYLAGAATIESPFAFLQTFVDRIDAYPTHVRAHPPGMALVTWTLARAGGGPAWLAGIEIAAAASAAPAVLLALREVAGEDRARAAAPFLALAPAAVSVASSGDAFFAGVGAWAVTLVVLASGRRDRRGDAFALGGGLVFGLTAFLSYGLVLLAAIPVAVCGARRRPRPILLAALGAAPVVLAFLWAGFWWVDGLLATRVQYLESVARLRPLGYFLVANVAAFAIVLGPVSVAGLASLRSSSLRLLVLGALAAVALADLSGMSKAEVERIWLPFAPWVLLAAASLPANSRREWLAANIGFGLALELAVKQPW